MSLVFEHHIIGPRLCTTTANNHVRSKTRAASAKCSGRKCVPSALMYSISHLANVCQGMKKKELSLGTAGTQADRTEQTLSLLGRTLFARKPLPP